MKQSKYLLILSKSRINLDHKEKLFLDLNQLKRINTCKIRLLSDSEIQGIKKRYEYFLKIIPYETLSEEALKIFDKQDTPYGKIRFNGNQKKKSSFRLSVTQVKIILR